MINAMEFLPESIQKHCRVIIKYIYKYSTNINYRNNRTKSYLVNTAKL